MIEELGQHVAKPSVKQHLAALRMLFDYLVTGRCCQNGGTIQHAQQIANHESPRTIKLYDRTSDAISLDGIERIFV